MRFGSHRFYGELDIVCNALLYICYLCDEMDRRFNEVTINTKEESRLYEKEYTVRDKLVSSIGKDF